MGVCRYMYFVWLKLDTMAAAASTTRVVKPGNRGMQTNDALEHSLLLHDADHRIRELGASPNKGRDEIEDLLAQRMHRLGMVCPDPDTLTRASAIVRVESSVDISSMSTPPISAVTARVDLLSHDMNSVEYYGGGDEVRDWCDICSRYDRCECHDEALSCDGGPEDEEREWCEVCGRLDRCRCEATVTPPIKEPPPPPPKWMATGACQCYLCKKPITVVEPAVKNRRIMVVEPGDLNYATDGVPWSVCSRCGVFRPFANVTEESCLNVIGIQCSYGESEWEAQHQEPARGSTEEPAHLCSSVGCISPSGHVGYCTTSTGEFFRHRDGLGLAWE